MDLHHHNIIKLHYYEFLFLVIERLHVAYFSYDINSIEEIQFS